MIEDDHPLDEKRVLERRSASHIFVPDTFSFVCMILSVEVFFTMVLILSRSELIGESVKAFPANMTYPNSILRDLSKRVSIRALAFSSLFGLTSSAFIEADISSVMTTCFFTTSLIFEDWSIFISNILRKRREKIPIRVAQRDHIKNEIHDFHFMKVLSTGMPIFSRKYIPQRTRNILNTKIYATGLSI